MKMIILTYLAICIAVCVLKRVMPILIAAGFLASWYMVCYGNMQATGAILFLFMCLVTTIYRIARHEEFRESRQPSKSRQADRKGRCSGYRWILYLIPIFWPFLVLRLFLDDKPRPTDMTPYDYEQHEKCNR